MIDLKWLIGTLLFLTALQALFGFQFAAGFAIGSFATAIFALWEAGAKAIEAQRAETVEQGSVHESAVANGDLPNPYNLNQDPTHER